MKRWNNFPRIEDVSHLDNVGYVIHIALFLAYIEEQNGKKIDRKFLIKRIIFNSLGSLILSDINSGTRDYIMKTDSSIFSELEKKAFESIFSKESPDYIKNDMKNTLFNTSNKLELDIILASKKYAGYSECEINSKVFYDMYEVPLAQIKQSLDVSRKNLKSVDILLSNNNYRKFLNHIRRLNHSTRWNRQNRVFPISVMSHLVIVTFLSYILGMIENNSGGKYSIEDLLLRSIYHDIPEAITGDIITPIKNAIPGFREVLEEVEINMMNDYIFSSAANGYKDIISNYIYNPFEGESGKLAKKSDIFSALFEARVEENNGSLDFGKIYKNIKSILNKEENISVNYLLKYSIDDFDEDLSDKL